MNEEPPYVREARKSLATLVSAFDQMAAHISSRDASDHDLSNRVAELTRLLKETEQRAILAEQRSDALSGKAGRNDLLEESVGKLLAALDRLPVTMDAAGIIPGANKPAIALYGTYDWQAVMDAKLALKAALKP